MLKVSVLLAFAAGVMAQRDDFDLRVPTDEHTKFHLYGKAFVSLEPYYGSLMTNVLFLSAPGSYVVSVDGKAFAFYSRWDGLEVFLPETIFVGDKVFVFHEESHRTGMLVVTSQIKWEAKQFLRHLAMDRGVEFDDDGPFRVVDLAPRCLSGWQSCDPSVQPNPFAFGSYAVSVGLYRYGEYVIKYGNLSMGVTVRDWPKSVVLPSRIRAGETVSVSFNGEQPQIFLIPRGME